MNNRELKIKLISEQLARLEIQVRNVNAQNLCDLNSISENSICGILNLIFGYRLINLNSEKSNYVGIDLADSRNRISVQITSDKSKKKIQYGYHGYPTLYVEYNNNGSPVEKKLYGLIGFYDFEKPQKSRKAYYFGEKKKKIKTE